MEDYLDDYTYEAYGAEAKELADMEDYIAACEQAEAVGCFL